MLPMQEIVDYRTTQFSLVFDQTMKSHILRMWLFFLQKVFGYLCYGFNLSY